MREPQIAAPLQRRADLALAFVEVSLLQAHGAERVVGRRQSRVLREHRVELALGVGRATGIEQRLRQLLPRLHVRRIHVQKPFVAGDGIVRPSDVAVHVRHVPQREIVVWFQLERPAILRQRPIVMALPCVLVPEQQPCVDDLRILRDDPLQHLDARRRFARVLELLARVGHQVEQIDFVFRIREHQRLARSGGDKRAHVAERRKPRAHVGVDVDGLLRALGRIGFTRAHRRAHPIGQRPARGVQVVRFAGILLDVVELWPGRADVLVAPRRQGPQLAPAEMVAWVERLGIRIEPEIARGPGHQRHERASVDRSLQRNAQQLEERRRQIDRTHGRVNAPALSEAGGRRDRERHVQDRVVHEEPMRALGVLAETLPVIADDRDNRLLEQASSLEESDQSPDLRIDERDFARVRPAREPRAVRLRRVVRRVRVVEMHPREEARRGRRVEPRKRAIGDLVRRPLDARRGLPLRLVEIEVVDIRVEPLRNAPPAIQDIGADEPAGPKPCRREPLGERRLTRVELEPAVVADAVLRRVLRREQRRVRRQRERHGGHRLLEDHTARGDAIEVRRLAVLRAVGAEAVGARRVERDQQQVEVARARARRRRTPQPDRGARSGARADDDDGGGKRAEGHGVRCRLILRSIGQRSTTINAEHAELAENIFNKQRLPVPRFCVVRRARAC